MKYTTLKQAMLGKCCRECLNRVYHLKLERQDCLYIRYPGKCMYCGDIKNIVEDIRWSGRIKLIF